jgi:tetratricopeptide (TPR) repeat protein
MGLYTAHLERTHVGALGDMWDYTFIERCLIAGRAICFYAVKLVWPADLTFFYPRWEIDGGQAWQYAYPALAITAAVLLWIGRRRFGKGPLVAFLFFAGTLFPALGFFDVYPMKFSFVADHFQYLASIGLIVLAAAAVHRLAGRLGGSGIILRRAALGAVLAVLGYLAHEQCKVYRNPITLWTDTIEKNPDAFLAHNNLGVLLHKGGKIAEAIEHFEEALRIDPDDDFAHTNMGMALMEQGAFEESITYFQRAVDIDPENALAHNNWGVALFRLGRFSEAVRQHARALDIYRSQTGYRAGTAGEADALNNLGIALFKLGRAEEAVSYIREALAINPGNPMAHLNLGAILQKLGSYREALESFRKVLSLVPDQGSPYHQRARAEIERTQQLMRRG